MENSGKINLLLFFKGKRIGDQSTANEAGIIRMRRGIG